MQTAMPGELAPAPVPHSDRHQLAQRSPSLPSPTWVEGSQEVPLSQPQIGTLPGARLHLQHGPIDLIIKAEGAAQEVAQAYQAAIGRFESMLGELAAELVLLRKPLKDKQPAFNSPVARRMREACWPHRACFITPMAAVAGAVADEIKAVMLAASPTLSTLYVNNGGDIAVHVAEGHILKIGLVADLANAIPDGVISITHASGIGGIATSGWRGRSFSRGIADAVTVLAKCAADADAAATMIGNAVDAHASAVSRAPAVALDPDSDLGAVLVTTDVGPLSQAQISTALDKGGRTASRMIEENVILAAFMGLQDKHRIFLK